MHLPTPIAPIEESGISSSITSDISDREQLTKSILISPKFSQSSSSADKPSLLKSDDATVGYQFLLGILPFTRLQFESGVTSAIQELLIEQLLEQYSSVLVLSATDQNTESNGELSPISISLESRFAEMQKLRFGLESLSINGFDAILFRIRKVSGRFMLETTARLETDTQNPIKKVLPFEATEYGLYAHASELSALLKRTLIRTLRSAPIDDFQIEMRNLVDTHRIKCDEDKPNLLIVQPPVSLTVVNSEYGDISKVDLQENRELRATQLGIERAVLASGYAAISVVGKPFPTIDAQRRLCPGDAILETNVQERSSLKAAGGAEKTIYRFRLIDRNSHTISDSLIAGSLGRKDLLTRRNDAQVAFKNFFSGS